jgi:hypothetical protein
MQTKPQVISVKYTPTHYKIPVRVLEPLDNFDEPLEDL